MIMLSKEEKEYNSRQLLDLSVKEQERLKDSDVTVVGAGGLGSPVLEYLARAGVGFIKIIDRGKVIGPNLNRQFYTREDIGKPKAHAAMERLLKINPHIKVSGLNENLDKTNDILIEGDVVVDALDTMDGKLMLAKSCKVIAMPMVHGAVEGWKGYQLTCLPGKGYLKHLEGKKASTGTFPILGPTAGVIGCIQAMETIKLLTGKGKPNTDLLVFDGKNNILERVKL